jgi:hypothetical protein
MIITALILPGVTSTSVGQGPKKIRIAVVGDSMAEGYWDGLARVIDGNACLRARFEVARFSRDSSGLKRSSYPDWPSELRRIGASFKPQLFLMSIGTNDLGYDEKYRERVVAVVESAVTNGAGLFWIGLPAMRATLNDRDGREKNKLFEDVLSGFGNAEVEYLEPWKLNGLDKYASYGPDQYGRIVQIRTPDGIHFTFAGNLLTGLYLLPKVLAKFRAAAEPCEKYEARSE